MATELLNNCHFDLTRIKKLYMATESCQTIGGALTPIVFPVNFNTLTGSGNSIIDATDWQFVGDYYYVTIGTQIIGFKEIHSVMDNITFVEELIIDQRGRNYLKTLTFELNGMDVVLINELESLGLDKDGKYAPPKTLALLEDENDQFLLVGYDFPMRLETINNAIDGENNNIILTYTSISKTRARSIT